MKIDQQPAVFRPVVMTLETPEDLEALKSVVDFAIINARTGSPADIAAKNFRDLLRQIGAML